MVDKVFIAELNLYKRKLFCTIEGEFVCVAEGCKSLRLYGQAIKRTWWMPWQPEAMKDVVGSEMLRGAVKQALIRRCPNGETRPTCGSSLTEYIGQGSERGELKHLSTRRKRNQLRFPK